MIELVMMGDPNAGRTSIAKIIFQKYVTRETMSLATTAYPNYYDFKIHELNFRLHDIPSQTSQEQHLQQSFCNLSKVYAFIYVINPQLNTSESLERFYAIYQFMKKKYKQDTLSFFIFIHKYDIELENPEAQDQLVVKMKINLKQKEVELPKVNFQFTSILNYSIYQAFSKVIQKILPCTPFLVKMLNTLAQFTRIQKVFVYDLVTKLVIAHNCTSRDIQQTYDICSEILDLYVNLNLCMEETSEQEQEKPRRGKVQVKVNLGGSYGYKIFRFKQIENSLAICFFIEEVHYERVYLIDQNINTFADGLIKMMNEMIQFL